MPKFIGDKAAVHIHDEGRRAHFKRGTDNKTRHNFDTQDGDQMEEAIKALKDTGWSGESGYDACIKGFKKLGYD